MPCYSEEPRQAVVARLLPPHPLILPSNHVSHSRGHVLACLA